MKLITTREDLKRFDTIIDRAVASKNPTTKKLLYKILCNYFDTKKVGEYTMADTYAFNTFLYYEAYVLAKYSC